MHSMHYIQTNSNPISLHRVLDPNWMAIFTPEDQPKDFCLSFHNLRLVLAQKKSWLHVSSLEVGLMALTKATTKIIRLKKTIV